MPIYRSSQCIGHSHEKIQNVVSMEFAYNSTSIANPNNNKQKLHNDFIAFLASKDLKWCADEIDTNGESFMKAIVDTLWYIDGQHQV